MAAILSICGTTTTLTSCSGEVDNPVVQPVPSVERDRFEQQLSTMLDQAVKLQDLQPTLRAAEVLTGFIEQLNVEALAPQISTIIASVVSGLQPVSFESMGDDQSDARAALKNTFSALAETEGFVLADADKVLGTTRMTFIAGEQGMTFETGVTDGLVIAYKNPTTNEGTEVKFQFTGVDKGVTLFLAKVSNVIPVAVQLPATISFSIKKTQGDVATDVIDGVVSLVSPEGKKYISMKESEWVLSVITAAADKNRFELPMATMHHYADGRVEGQADLTINETKVLSLAIKNNGIPYNDTEMEQLKVLREQGPLFAGFYEVLSAFNSRGGNAMLTVMDDLVFDVNVKDIAQAAVALGSAIKYHDQQPDKSIIDPMTAQLNQCIAFTVTQKSTGVKADGMLITSDIKGSYQPALALRFKDEADYQVMYDNLSAKDLANYESLLQSFDAPGRQLHKLYNAFNEKRKEIQNVKLF